MKTYRRVLLLIWSVSLVVVLASCAGKHPVKVPRPPCPQLEEVKLNPDGSASPPTVKVIVDNVSKLLEYIDNLVVSCPCWVDDHSIKRMEVDK